MKNPFLVSAVLLASTAGQLSAADVADIQSHAINTIEAKGKLSFVGSEVVTTAKGSFRPYLQLIPVEGGAYEFMKEVPGNALGKEPGQDPGLEYQLVIQLVDITSAKVEQTDAQYFAKVQDGGEIKAYFCDTTSVCSEDRGSKVIGLKGDVLTISGAEFFGNGLSGDLQFIAIPK